MEVGEARSFGHSGAPLSEPQAHEACFGQAYVQRTLRLTGSQPQRISGQEIQDAFSKVFLNERPEKASRCKTERAAVLFLVLERTLAGVDHGHLRSLFVTGLHHFPVTDGTAG